MMDGREQPAGVVIPGAAPAYARRRKRPDEAADRLPRPCGASAPVRSPRSWTQPFARPDSLVSRHGLSTGLHPASIEPSLAARSRSAAIFSARTSPEPPFGAGTVLHDGPSLAVQNATLWSRPLDGRLDGALELGTLSQWST